MNAMLLAYALPEEKLARLRFLCLRLGVKVVAVPEAEYAQPLGALCGLLPRAENPAEAEAPGEMLVMAHFNTQQANRLLASMKQARLPVRLKAVVTPTNMHWNAAELCAELAKEREAVARGGKAGHEE